MQIQIKRDEDTIIVADIKNDVICILPNILSRYNGASILKALSVMTKRMSESFRKMKNDKGTIDTKDTPTLG